MIRPRSRILLCYLFLFIVLILSGAQAICLDTSSLPTSLPTDLPAGLPTSLPTDLPGGLPSGLPSLPGLSIPAFDIGMFLPTAAAKSVMQTFGNLLNHRPYLGVEPLEKTTEIGIDATLMKLPKNFGSSLPAGMSLSTSNLPALPMVKPHFAKGFGHNVDIGLSGIYLMGNYLLGGDVKVLVFEPEEGLKWAFRIGYNAIKVDLSKWKIKKFQIKVQGIELGSATVVIRNQTITPMVIASKAIDFAEAYGGFAANYTEGQIDIPITINILKSTQTLSTPVYGAAAYWGFMGVSFKIPYVGIRIGMEGSYNFQGMHTMGIYLGGYF